MTDPRYPIGEFAFGARIDAESERANDISRIAALPAAVRRVVTGVDEAGLSRSYREGGWTVRQLIHHLPDSHMNGFIRLKLALTEESPTIKPYDEARWATLADVRDTDPEVSLVLLESIHTRWVNLLRSMNVEDFARGYVHPEHGRFISLDESLASYAWHGDHHLAHLKVALAK